jgi:hypothetical protein
MSVKSILSTVFFCSRISLLIFGVDVLSIDESEVLRSHTIIVSGLICSFSSELFVL